MRIFHLIPTLGQGGAERQLSLLAPALALEGIKVAVAFHEGGENFQALEGSGVSIYQMPPRSNYDPRLLIDIASIVEDFQPDIIQTWLPQMDVLGGLVAAWKRTKHVLSERSSAEAYTHAGWKLRLRTQLGRRAAAIVANSESGLNYWQNLGAGTAKHIIRNALTPINIKEPLYPTDLKNYRLLVSAGRLAYEKNIGVLIDSLAGALRLLPNHHAIIFGDGPEKERAIQLVQASDVADRLHLAGYTDSLYWWLHRADCFLSTSLVEGHPNAVVEAAASRCPLVLSDIPAHREFFVDGSAQFLSTQDTNGFINAIVESVMNLNASRIRAERAKLLVDQLSLDRAVGKYIDLYRGILLGDGK